MRRPVGLLVVVMFGALALGAGCNGKMDLPTSPSLQAATVTAVTNPDTPFFEVTPSGSTATTGSTPGPCAYDSSTGQFTCTDVSKDGITFSRTVIYKDASGNTQSKFDAATTASIEVKTSASGTTTRPNGDTVTVNRSGDMITTGLAGTETTRTINGAEQGTVVAVSTTKEGATATVSTTIADSTNNLVMPVPSKRPDASTPQLFPLSGSRTHATTITATQGSTTKTTTSSRTETFNGTSTVQVTVTINGTTSSCTEDLTNHSNTCGK